MKCEKKIFWFWFPKTVLRKPNNLLHFYMFFVTLDTCSFQVRSEDIWTPRRRRLVAMESFVLETKYSRDGLFLRRLIHITRYFCGFSWRALFSDHQWRVARSFWRNWTSESLLITWKKEKVSSAHWKLLERRWRWRSLTRILKSRSQHRDLRHSGKNRNKIGHFATKNHSLMTVRNKWGNSV